MKFGVFVSAVYCPRCGAPFHMSGMTDDREPELHTKKCPICGQMMAIRRDPATGELKAEEVKPA